MKKTFVVLTCILALFSYRIASAQQPIAASDFTISDCDGTDHHLYDVCDSGHVVMIEFVMGCLPCVQGRKALTSIENQFNASHPGKIHTYTFGYSAGTSCSSIQSWMTSNKFSGAAFGGDQDIITNYGAEGGMPTIAIVGGTDRKLLFWRKGFTSKDTIAMKTAIAKILPQASVASSNGNESLSIYPNPSAKSASLKIDCLKDDTRRIDLYNANGVNVLSIFNGRLSTGEHTINFSTNDLASGTYYVHVTTNGKTSIMPLTIVH